MPVEEKPLNLKLELERISKFLGKESARAKRENRDSWATLHLRWSKAAFEASQLISKKSTKSCRLKIWAEMPSGSILYFANTCWVAKEKQCAIGTATELFKKLSKLLAQQLQYVPFDGDPTIPKQICIEILGKGAIHRYAPTEVPTLDSWKHIESQHA